MPTVSENNKRIAKNTLFLYFRQLLVMAVSLYTVRVVLAELGAEDYGIYNVVGGFVAMFSIISGSMTLAVNRFITIEIGKDNVLQATRIFSTSVIILLLFSILVCIGLETFGVWFLNDLMDIPDGRTIAANWALQLSLLAFVINLMSVPYNAVIIAHERMSVFALISILEVTLKLAVVFVLKWILFDKLITYACLTTLVALIIRTVYAVYCKRHFEESRFKFTFDKGLLCDMLGFTGWAFWGNSVILLKDQGVNVLLNLFCGPVVNAAQGIAMQINAAVYSFVSNFMIAIRPQIIKNHASGNFQAMHIQIIKSGKFGFFIMLLILLPLCGNIDYVLGLWLVDVPAHTANFVVLVLLYSLLDGILTPIAIGVFAQGEIKAYEIALCIIYAVNFIASYVCLKLGMAPETVFVLNIAFKACVLADLMVHSKAKYAFPVHAFLKQCLLPSAVVVVLSGAFTYFMPSEAPNSFWEFLLHTLAIIICTSLMALAIGMTKGERLFLKKNLRDKITVKLYRKI